MLGRIALAGVMLAAMGFPAAFAGSGYVPIWLLKKQCESLPATVKLCAYQSANGNRNWAVTRQKTELGYPKSSTVFSVTVQNGDDNAAYTGQYGTNLSSATIQVGNNNKAGTLQVGSNQKSTTIQVGDGIWSASASVGDDITTRVVARSY